MSEAIRHNGEYIGQVCAVDFKRGLCLSFESWEKLEQFLSIPNNDYITWDERQIKASEFKREFYSRGDAIYICSEHEMKARGWPEMVRRSVNFFNHILPQMDE